MKKLLMFAAALCLCMGLGAENWKLVWEEQFDGAEIDTTVWKRIPRGGSDWNNYMSQADSLFDLRDGKLILRGVVNGDLKTDTAPYLTGGVYTFGGKSFDPPFRVEVNAKFNAAKGEWPAFWMLPYDRSIKWPLGGEIDIMERLNYDDFAYQTVHSYYTKRLNQEDNPPHYATGKIDPDGFNTFAVEVTPDSLNFFVNDVRTFSYPKIETELEGQYPYFIPMGLLIDMQLGGSWVGPVDPADLPTHMEIDYVRYYRPCDKCQAGKCAEKK